MQPSNLFSDYEGTTIPEQPEKKFSLGKWTLKKILFFFLFIFKNLQKMKTIFEFIKNSLLTLYFAPVGILSIIPILLLAIFSKRFRNEVIDKSNTENFNKNVNIILNVGAFCFWITLIIYLKLN